LHRILGVRHKAEHAATMHQQLAAMMLDAFFAELRKRVHAWKLSHTCDTKPVLAAQTDFFDSIGLVILGNLLKTKEG